MSEIRFELVSHFVDHGPYRGRNFAREACATCPYGKRGLLGGKLCSKMDPLGRAVFRPDKHSIQNASVNGEVQMFRLLNKVINAIPCNANLDHDDTYSANGYQLNGSKY